MMELIRFLRWQWNKWEPWQKLWIIGAGFFGAGVAADEPLKFYFLAIPITIMFVCSFKWFVWEPMIKSWSSYKEEKQNLFETIKTSDQK